MKKFVTTREAAKHLDVVHSTLFYHVRKADANDLPRYKAARGLGYRYELGEISKWWKSINTHVKV